MSFCFFIFQLADAKDVMQAVHNLGGIKLPVLTPNLKVGIPKITINWLIYIQISDLLHLQGFEAAIAAGAREVAVFASASESFSKSNINCSVEESLARYRAVTRAAKELSIPVRGYAFYFLFNYSLLSASIYLLVCIYVIKFH